MKKLNIINEINKGIELNNDINLKNLAPYELVKHTGTKLYCCNKSYVALIFFFDEGEVHLDDQILQVLCGNILLLKYCDQVFLKLNSEKGTAYILYLKEELFDNYLISQMSDCPIFYDFLRLKSKKLEYLFFDCQIETVIHSYINPLLLESSNYHTGDNKLIKCALILLLSNLHNIHASHLIISESSMMEDYDIGKFLKYMTNNYSSVTLKSMAEHFNFHPSYFSQLFKQLAGATFSEKLLTIKLEHARRLLSTTNLSIKQIVDLIGFSEKSHFYKSFKKYYFLTPGEYRKSIKINRV